MERLSILIPFQTDHGQRERVFHWIVQFYKTFLPNADICIGTSSPPFSKAKAVNDAAKKARGTIFAIVDADTLLNPSVFKSAMMLLQDAPWLIPYNNVFDLTAESTNRLINEKPMWPLPKWLSFSIRKPLPVGGVNILRKTDFEKVGGFDERFHGWGGEDDAFAAAMNTFSGQYVRLDEPLYHLWHPPAERQKNEHYENNRALAFQYCRAQGRKHKMKAIISSRVK